MKKVVLGVLAFLVLAYIIFDKVSDAGLSKEFLQKQDSLVQAVDSMKLTLAIDSAKIDSLIVVDNMLTFKVAYMKDHVKTVTKFIDSSKAAVDTYSEKELVTSFNTRYPKDTVTNPLPVAQPVLVAAAKDLVELDGAKQIITIKDSAITILETKVSNKDSVISKYISKEDKFRLILLNKDQEIAGWEGQYQKIELQYNKLKVKSKLQRIGSYVVIGGLAYLMIAK
jgi:hypothetical protein